VTTLPTRLTGEGIPELLDVRGEAVLALEDLAPLNRWRKGEGDAVYATPRNAVAGLMASRGDIAPPTRVRVVFFELMGAGHMNFADEAVALSTMCTWGLPIIDPICVIQSEAAVESAVSKMETALSSFNLPTDGLVLKVTSLSLRKALGTSRRAPYWALAYKWNNQSATSRLLRVSWQVGRTGRVTPVAHFDPARLGGVTIARASLHNPSTISRLDLQRNDIVVLERAGGVIPKVTQVLKVLRTGRELPVAVPNRCVCCRHSLRREGGGLFCDNPMCVDRRVARLRYFLGPKGLGVSGVGPVAARRLVETAGIRSPIDLLTLRWERLEEAVKLGGLSEVAGARLHGRLKVAHTFPVSHWLAALSIPGVGPVRGKQLLAQYGSLQGVLASESLPVEYRGEVHRLKVWLMEMQGVGKGAAR
jgi:DNA ligase (NAD+)